MGVDWATFLIVAKWIGAFIISFWLTIPLSVHLLVICMGLDFLTGLISSYIGGVVTSHKGFVGVAKKVLILILVATSHFLAVALGLPFDLGSLVAAAYVVNEIISITENCSGAGVPIPPSLLGVLLKAKSATGRGDQQIVMEKLEAVTVTTPDGLGGATSISSVTKKTSTGSEGAV